MFNEKKLYVFLNNTRVGILEQSLNGDLSFTYDKTSQKIVSVSMPTTQDTYIGDIPKIFFGALLPDEQNKELLASKLGISATNTFSLLQEIGAECSGALSIIENDKIEKIQESITTINLETINELLPIDNISSSTDMSIRVSIAGAQTKVALIYKDKYFYKPTLNNPSTHIIKSERSDLIGIVKNEDFCMKLANKIGIEVAKTDIIKHKDREFILVKRFDRQENSRIHQEDFCQVLSIPSELKYQRENNNASIAEIFKAIKQHCTIPALEIKKILSMIIYNFLIGNKDAHAKNFSIMHGDEICLTPGYDIICTQVFANISPRMAMEINGKYQADMVCDRDWKNHASNCGLGEKAFTDELYRIAKLLPDISAELADDMYGDEIPDIIKKVLDIIKLNCEKALIEK